MSKKDKFLKGFLIYAGVFEIVIAVGFCFFGPVCEAYSLGCFPLFYLMAAVELAILGFLLIYAARDIKRHLVIIVASCVFRFIMLGPSIYTAVTVGLPIFTYILIGTMTYDTLSAILTLVLLQQCGYFKKEQGQKVTT